MLKNISDYVVYIDDQFVALENKLTTILDLGLIRGFGTFEMMRTYQKQPFKIIRHLDRLFHSLELLQLPISQSKEDLVHICSNVLEKTHLEEKTECRLAILITPNTSLSLKVENECQVIVYSLPLIELSQSVREEGIKVQTIAYERYLPECKSFQYLPQMLALNKNPKIDEVLYINRNEEILEGGASNFFGFHQDTLMTANQNILKGITREVVLELAKSEFSIDLRAITASELSGLDEAFVTSSTKEIVPIKQIDHIQIGNGKVGLRTSRLMHLFNQYTKQIK